MPQIEFGSRKAANETRNRVEQYLSRTDDRRETTVRLQSSAPDSIMERVKEAAFESREQRSKGAGKADLGTNEQKSLKRQHDTFNWQQHGFEAMSVKAAVQSEGVTEWMDYYEPGEGVESALAKVREAKSGAQQSRASIGVQGMRTDTADERNTGRRSKQAERASAQRTKSAKRPAIVEQDTDAMEYLREERQFGEQPFDITTDLEGHSMDASGRDVELVEERNQQRSEHARLMDDLQAADVTTDPLEWAENPAQMDFPGVDTLEPEKVHERRPEQAQEVDENERAPIADSRREWAAQPDQFDWPGVDTPNADADEMKAQADREIDGDLDSPIEGDVEAAMIDDRDQQDTLGFAADPTEARESRTAVESSSGGLMEDTRENAGRGPETNDVDPGEQAGLNDIDAANIGREADRAMKDMDKDMRDLNQF